MTVGIRKLNREADKIVASVLRRWAEDVDQDSDVVYAAIERAVDLAVKLERGKPEKRRRRFGREIERAANQKIAKVLKAWRLAPIETGGDVVYQAAAVAFRIEQKLERASNA